MRLVSVSSSGVCRISLFFSFSEGVCDYGDVPCCEDCVYILFSNGVWVCTDNSCLSSVIECGLFLESVSVFV